MPVIGDEIGLQLDQIVLATDFSPHSLIAEYYARALADRFYSRVTVAHVVDPSVATASGSSVVGSRIDQMRHQGDEGLQRVVSELKEAGIRGQGKMLEAHNAASAIVNLAQKMDADMIVMGTRAQRGLNKMMVGSCAQGVIHHAQCPVVTVGPRVKKLAAPKLCIENIVFATDLKHDVSMKAGIALTFAKDSVCHIHVCHVLDHTAEKFGDTLESQVEAEAKLRKLIPKPSYEWCSPSYIVEAGQVGNHVLQIAKKVNADLIVLGAHRNATWFTHLAEGVIGHVVAEAECPVMTICTD